MLRLLSLIFLGVFFTGCIASSTSGHIGRGDTRPGAASAQVMQKFDRLITADTQGYAKISSRFLDSDGPNNGLSAYNLIREFGGSKPIESPDLYAINHPDVPHIYEDTDKTIGDHFVFVIHRDIDRDRDRAQITDRQRNEIKTYASSETAVKGYENESMLFRWKFRINSEMEVSRRFSHFFQLKAVGGEDSQPLITLTGNTRGSEDGLEVRHSPSTGGSVLGRVDWTEVAGEWIEVYCRATFSEQASLRLIAARLNDGEILFDIDATDLDMWRGESPKHFVRPKWGIYRSLAEFESLRPDEEDVRFANFRVDKVELL